MKTKYLRMLSLMILLAMIVSSMTTACGPKATDEPTPASEPKELVIAYKVQYSETFDITRMVYGMEPTHMIYDNLVSVDTNYEYKPGGLAERWEVSEDGLVITFYLKQGVTFHDGSEFNAEVLKWWLEEMVKEGACCAYMYNAITEIEIIDDYTIALHTEKPFPALFYYLSGLWGLIMSQQTYEVSAPTSMLLSLLAPDHSYSMNGCLMSAWFW